MKYFRIIQVFICLMSLQAIAQSELSPVQQKVATNLHNYFALDRENIHLHLNKNVFLSNENIWLKGYIIEKKNLPTHNATNIYLNLWDENGQKIATQLYFAENGLFDGYLSIPKEIKTGTYYIQAFTNYMNNFSEDESSIYRVTLVNVDDKNFGVNRKINFDTVDVGIFPESRIFLDAATNTFAIHIADCAGLGIKMDQIEISDANGHLIGSTSTDQFGYGRFDIYDASQQNYRIRFLLNGNKHERFIPLPTSSGFSLAVNSFLIPDKVNITVKTNAVTLQNLNDINYTLVVQQNDAVSFIDVKFGKNSLEQNISIPRVEILPGINTIYLIDSNLKMLAERVIYNPFNSVPKTILKVGQKSTNSINIAGISSIKAGTLSISILPSETLSLHPQKSFQGSLIFDNYLSEPIENLDYYLSDLNKKKHYELDHILITKKSKYDWNKMHIAAPQEKYESDFGLTVKGKLASNNVKSEISKINMKSSSLGFDEFKSLDSHNEFVFKNLLAVDSSKIYFLPKDKTGKVLPYRFTFQITDNNRRFNKPFVSNKLNCATEPIYEDMISFPKIENAIQLDSISVMAKNNKLKYRNRIGNMTARSFKITDSDANKNLLSFIAANGFFVSKSDGSVHITSNMASHNQLMRITANSKAGMLGTLNAPGQRITTGTRTAYSSDDGRISSPAVFIDDVLIPNYDILHDFGMNRIDEIFLNKTSNDLSSYGTEGYIKIYTKMGQAVVSSIGSPSIVIKNGFQKYIPFQNLKYSNLKDGGFQKLGTIYWNPIVETDENGSFTFKIPNLYQKSVSVIIEGINADGIMISESHILQLE